MIISKVDLIVGRLNMNRAALPPITKENIFYSDRLQEFPMGHFRGFAYRGEDLKKDTSSEPVGIIQIAKYGLVFLPVEDAVLHKLGKAAEDLLRKPYESKTSSEVSKIVQSLSDGFRHYDSFGIPYWELEEVKLKQMGMLSKRGYLMITTRDNQSKYVITPDYKDKICSARFPLAAQLLTKFLDLRFTAIYEWTISQSVDPLMKKILKELESDGLTKDQLGSTSSVERINKRLEEELGSTGTSINALVLETFRQYYSEAQSYNAKGVKSVCSNQFCSYIETREVGSPCPKCGTLVWNAPRGFQDGLLGMKKAAKEDSQNMDDDKETSLFWLMVFLRDYLERKVNTVDELALHHLFQVVGSARLKERQMPPYLDFIHVMTKLFFEKPLFYSASLDKDIQLAIQLGYLERDVNDRMKLWIKEKIGTWGS